MSWHQAWAHTSLFIQIIAWPVPVSERSGTQRWSWEHLSASGLGQCRVCRVRQAFGFIEIWDNTILCLKWINSADFKAISFDMSALQCIQKGKKVNQEWFENSVSNEPGALLNTKGDASWWLARRCQLVWRSGESDGPHEPQCQWHSGLVLFPSTCMCWTCRTMPEHQERQDEVLLPSSRLGRRPCVAGLRAGRVLDRAGVPLFTASLWFV